MNAVVRRVGFTGTRDGLQRVQHATLSRVLDDLFEGGAEEFHHGDCQGADEAAHAMARSLRAMRVVVHPPTVGLYRAWCRGDENLPPRPYLVRDEDIVLASDVLIACPREQDGEAVRSGTWATVRKARKHGVPVIVIRPNGSVERS